MTGLSMLWHYKDHPLVQAGALVRLRTSQEMVSLKGLNEDLQNDRKATVLEIKLLIF